jgi:hypothetical protein
MNREIKFKIYDTGRKQWVHKDPVNLFGEVIIMGEILRRFSGDETIVPLTELNNLVALEFIGLPDKNGVEIYADCDIFKFKFLEELDRPIELLGKFTFGSDLSYEIDVIGNDNYTCLHYIDNGKFFDFEVIGNIYDNPELLNGESK